MRKRKRVQCGEKVAGDWNALSCEIPVRVSLSATAAAAEALFVAFAVNPADSTGLILC